VNVDNLKKFDPLSKNKITVKSSTSLPDEVEVGGIYKDVQIQIDQ